MRCNEGFGVAGCLFSLLLIIGGSAMIVIMAWGIYRL